MMRNYKSHRPIERASYEQYGQPIIDRLDSRDEDSKAMRCSAVIRVHPDTPLLRFYKKYCGKYRGKCYYSHCIERKRCEVQ